MPQSHKAFAWTHPLPLPSSHARDGAPKGQVIESRATRAILVPTRPLLKNLPQERRVHGSQYP